MEQMIASLLASGGGANPVSAMNPITAGLQALPEAYKAGLAIKQAIDANRIRKNLVRPDMTISQGMNEATDVARMSAMDTRLPGQDIIQEQLARNLATSVGGIMNSGGGSSERMAAMVGANQAGADALASLGVSAAQMQQADQQALANQMNLVGQQQDRMWDWNQRQKFLSAAQRASELGNSANTNMYSALKGLGGAAASAIQPPQVNTPSVQAAPAGGVVGPPTYEQFTDMQLTPLAQRKPTYTPAVSVTPINGFRPTFW